MIIVDIIGLKTRSTICRSVAKVIKASNAKLKEQGHNWMIYFMNQQTRKYGRQRQTLYLPPGWRKQELFGLTWLAKKPDQPFVVQLQKSVRLATQNWNYFWISILIFFSLDWIGQTLKTNTKHQMSAKVFVSKQKEKKQGCSLLFLNSNNNKKLWLTFGV